MRANLFWFSDGQWARIEPFIPSNRRGVKPKNNRRILSGIMHVLKSGCRWVDCPPEMGRPRRSERMARDSTHVKAHRCAGGGKGGASEQAIGITKGGRNMKIHGLVDKLCRPWVLILTPGNTADCTVGPACVSLLDGIAELLGDKAYDSDSFRKSLRKDGIKPVIPGRSNRKKRIRHDKQAYKDRNVIERCYCRLKDFRRIATRYDKLARNYFSALCRVAAVAFWL